jgi:rubrerythrin
VMDARYLAHYRCVRCGHEWRQKPAPVTCPKCGSLYVRWVNYNNEKWVK